MKIAIYKNEEAPTVFCQTWVIVSISKFFDRIDEKETTVVCYWQ